MRASKAKKTGSPTPRVVTPPWTVASPPGPVPLMDILREAEAAKSERPKIAVVEAKWATHKEEKRRVDLQAVQKQEEREREEEEALFLLALALSKTEF